MKRIYLDHAAATRLRPEAQEAMIEVMAEVGNPSSVHTDGRAMAGLLHNARRSVASTMNVKPEEITFTSGATEALQIGMMGAFLASKNNDILLSPFVHAAVWHTAQMLEKRFGARIFTLPLDPSGQWDLERLDSFDFTHLALVVVEQVGSELGIIQDEHALVQWVKSRSQAIIMSDWAASIVSVPVQTGDLDMWCLSGEKFGAPAGIGVLWKKKGTPFEPFIAGTHELGMRPGTQNTLGAVGFAAGLVAHMDQKQAHIRTWNQLDLNPGLTKTADNTAPHIHHFMLPEGMRGDIFVAKADMAGVSISAGTACSSGAQKPSRALMALGYSEEDAKRGIRVSFGYTTTKEEVNEVSEILCKLF